MIGGERLTVQNRIIEYAREKGWQYINPNEALRLRGGETGMVLREIFEQQMMRLNSDFMDGNMIQELIRRIENSTPDIRGNRVVWEHLKGLKTVFVPEEKRERNVNLIDFANNGRNLFHVTDEFSFTNGRYTNRADIIFFFNGIPVFIVETKAAQKLNAIPISIEQILRYHRETPELMTVLQSFQLTDIIKFLYGPTCNVSDGSILNWKDENSGNFEELVKSFFDRDRAVRIIEDYILFAERDEVIKKVIFRSHQMRAVAKITERSQSNKKRGLIWHTQGSGKTFTMIVAARKIIDNPILQNPTVIMVVDRNELESQLFQNLSAIGFGSVQVAETKSHLQNLLREDHRGLIVTTIQKFDGVLPNISTRKNIFVFIDEAHRSTGNKLGNFMMGALPNATYIGFTGTPVARTSGSNTFMTFGRDDSLGYLDKYGIRESIQDGTTVPLNYEIAPNSMLIDRETLEKEFLDVTETMGVSDVEELNTILQKQVTLRNMMKNEKRIDQIAEHVANHFKANVEPMGYKAFMVTVDREACVLYKTALDRFLPSSYSEVIMSSSNNDSETMKMHHKSEDEEKIVRKNFQKPDNAPRILIVTDKLLTGFDAPILYAMYLDKPMRDHVLLQAIARINRPYEYGGRKKKYGLVTDFVGVFGSLKKALAFDSSDIEDIESVVRDLNILKKRFEDLIAEMKEKYLVPLEGLSMDRIIDKILEMFQTSAEAKENFVKEYDEISDIFEILSPDPFLREYLEDYKDLTSISTILKEAFGSTASAHVELSKKTAELVRNNTIASSIPGKLKIYTIDDKTIEKIMTGSTSDRERIFNLLISVRKFIEENLKNSPYLISIGERAQKIAEMHNQNLISAEEALKQIKALINDINSSQSEEKKTKFPKEVYAFYYFMKKSPIKDPESLADLFAEQTKKFPSWFTNERQEMSIKRSVINRMLSNGVKPGDAALLVKDTLEQLTRGLRNGTF
ncbi:MAG: HsdR family type I site-specific deoxyribonuclease [Candidatus Thermoplasmatota archaeon]|nr:HsdR family type I site-specific deoxyribonuclease [Candidatus Thermoplasmatota archaeon]